jgi:hypothetical protein
MVVEHHGGPKRLARFSVVIAPPRSMYFVFGMIAALTLVIGEFGSLVPAVVMAFGFVLLWITVTDEANRLEASIMAAAADAARELEGDRHVVGTASVLGQEADIEQPQAGEE